MAGLAHARTSGWRVVREGERAGGAAKRNGERLCGGSSSRWSPDGALPSFPPPTFYPPPILIPFPRPRPSPITRLLDPRSLSSLPTVPTPLSVFTHAYASGGVLGDPFNCGVAM